jgi:hypothetical protein
VINAQGLIYIYVPDHLMCRGDAMQFIGLYDGRRDASPLHIMDLLLARDHCNLSVSMSGDAWHRPYT